METTIELRNLTEEELDAVAAADRNLYYEEHNWFQTYFGLDVPLITST